jgi:hypothetical protein
MHVASIKPDIVNAQAFGGTDIEASIMRSNNNHLKYVLNKQYYSPSEWNTIYKGRMVEKRRGDTTTIQGVDHNNVTASFEIYKKMTRKRKLRYRNKSRKHR